ncbi:MAG: metallopeptidase family protein [Phycisphaerae bacterium]|jgi:predicted Zn-dependent protease with MMP-like domain
MIRVSPAQFDRAVEEALAEVPDEFKPYLDNVVVEVWERPDPRRLGQEDAPPDLLGLFVGLPLEEQGPELGHALPNRVLIFREPLCEMCESREELVEEIRITVLHEIGHHFGLDEDMLDELGYA